MSPQAGPHNLIIGTAGHVDHGKTALVEALTGINTDRFAEEQERGLTIDLGFAWLKLPGGAWAGIVDVPGHERFVKNMLAGATGIDLFMLIVAADEGVMPQTREHLTILDVLEVGVGMVVITKADLVDAEMMELVVDDVSEALKGTVFQDAPMVTASAKTREGLTDVVDLLERLGSQVEPRDIAGPARMQIDRSFSMKGFGTIVTGSLVRGRLRVNDELEVLPGFLRTRVRNLEVYEQHVDEIAAPCRVGVNLAGVARDDAQRGTQLVAPGSMSASWMLDVRLRLAAEARRPLAYQERVRIHHGAGEILGRVVLLEGDELAPGQEGLAQLRLETPAVAAAGDRFVVRRYSPAYAVGGGVVLDPRPARHRRREAKTLQRLRAIEEGGVEDRARVWARSLRGAPFAAADLASGMQLDAAEAEALLERLLDEGHVIAPAPGRYLDAEHADVLTQRILQALEGHHAQHPLQPAMAVSRLQAALGNPAQEALAWALRTLRDRELVQPEGAGWRLEGHSLALTEAQDAAIADLQRRVTEAGMAPPGRAEALELLPGDSAGAHALLDIALERGELVAAGEFIISAAALTAAKEQLIELQRERGPFSVRDVRDLWGSSRKYVVPILEYLDGAGFTRRDGDKRQIIGGQ